MAQLRIGAYRPMGHSSFQAHAANLVRGKCAGQWFYELRIDSRNVSLRNGLVIRIERAEGVWLPEYVGKISREGLNVPAAPVLLRISLFNEVVQAMLQRG